MTNKIHETNVHDLLLTQHEHDRTLYELPGVGQLQMGGYFGGTGANIIVGDRVLQCRSQGWFSRKFLAIDTDGTVAMQYTAPVLFPTRGMIPWAGRQLQFVTSSRGKHRLSDGRKVHLSFEGLKSKVTPVRVRLRTSELPPELVMFATYLAHDRQRRAVGTTSTSSGGTSAGACSSGCSTGCSGGSSGCGGGGGGCGGGGCGGGS